MWRSCLATPTHERVVLLLLLALCLVVSQGKDSFNYISPAARTEGSVACLFNSSRTLSQEDMEKGEVEGEVEGEGEGITCYDSWARVEKEIQSLPSTITVFDFTVLDKSSGEVLTLGTLSRFTSLQYLAWRGGAIRNITASDLRHFPNLAILDLGGNGIEQIEPNAFIGLSKLRKLSLNDNLIASLTRTVFEPLVEMKIIFINNNLLSYISAEHFGHNVKLEEVHIQRNQLDKLDGMWGHLQQLTSIYASHNKIKSLDKTTFAGSVMLRMLLLDHNAIEVIEPGALDRTKGDGGMLLEVFLSHNNLSELDPEVFAQVDPLFVLYADYNRIRHIDPELFKNNDNLNHLRLNNNAISTIDKSTFASLTTLASLELANNSITHLHKDTLQMQDHLQELDLAGNRLSTLDHRLLDGLRSLQYLYLENNNLTYFNGSVLAGRTDVLKKVILSDNPWNCSCDLFTLVSWTKENPEIIARLDDTFCSYPQSASGIRFADVSLDHCVEDPGGHGRYRHALAGVCCTVVILAGLLVVSLYFRKEIEILLFIKFNIRLRKTKALKPEEEAQLKYDAFISFNQADFPFVRNDIMPRLESQSEFKLCVHFRDFALGAAIATNISDAIDQSSRTIMLLSRNFLDSEWCHYEFQQVHYKAMKEGTQRLIVILLEDIPPKDIKDKPLRTYITSHTYLHRNDKLFWERLLYEMPSKSVLQRESQVTFSPEDPHPQHPVQPASGNRMKEIL